MSAALIHVSLHVSILVWPNVIGKRRRVVLPVLFGLLAARRVPQPTLFVSRRALRYVVTIKLQLRTQIGTAGAFASKSKCLGLGTPVVISMINRIVLVSIGLLAFTIFY